MGDTGSFPAANLGSKASVEWWIYFNEASTESVNQQMAVSTAWDDSSTGGWSCLNTTNKIGWTGRYTDQSSKLETDIDISTGAWHHVACQYDGTEIRLYLDGKKVASAASSGAVDSYSGHMLLMHRNKWVPAPDINYLVRDVRVGDQAIYTEDFSPNWDLDPLDSTVALFHADDGSGSALNNAISGAPDASLSGSYAWSTVSHAYCDNPIACGNGVIEGNEACDDGNTNADDGCTANCSVVDP